MKKKHRMVMRTKARSIRGLVNVLQSDADYVFTDVEGFDIISLGESLRELKCTLNDLVDSVAELEYALYLSNSEDA